MEKKKKKYITFFFFSHSHFFGRHKTILRHSHFPNTGKGEVQKPRPKSFLADRIWNNSYQTPYPPPKKDSFL